MKKKVHNKKIDDDEVSVRQKVRLIMDGKFVTTIMTLLTLFALFGDNFRLWFFTLPADPYFYGILTWAFFMFLMELLINSWV
jgi:hypothetical protein